MKTKRSLTALGILLISLTVALPADALAPKAENLLKNEPVTIKDDVEETDDPQSLEAWMFNDHYLIAPAPAAQVATFNANEAAVHSLKKTRGGLALAMDKSVIEYLARIYAGQLDASDIVRLQRICGKIDHITVSFCDDDACDYVLTFKKMDEQQLEKWMFSAGYLLAGPEPEPVVIEPWMTDPEYLD